eukprot:5133333-Amphidinium_carterae.1
MQRCCATGSRAPVSVVALRWDPYSAWLAKANLHDDASESVALHGHLQNLLSTADLQVAPKRQRRGAQFSLHCNCTTRLSRSTLMGHIRTRSLDAANRLQVPSCPRRSHPCVCVCVLRKVEPSNPISNTSVAEGPNQ